MGNDHGIRKGGRCRCQQQAGPRASCPALISSPAPRDCRSFILAALLSQQSWQQVLRASWNPGLGRSEPQILSDPSCKDPRSDDNGLKHDGGACQPQTRGCPDATGMGSALHSLGPQTLLAVSPSSYLLHPTRVSPWDPYLGAEPPGSFGWGGTPGWPLSPSAQRLSPSVWHRGRGPHAGPSGLTPSPGPPAGPLMNSVISAAIREDRDFVNEERHRANEGTG